MSFQDVANSTLLYLLVIFGLLYIIAFASVFLIQSYKRCLELGIDKKTIYKVIKSTLIFTIVPSIAIVIGFYSLATVFGIPWPWWRLSVLGSVAYELMAADMAAKGMGYNSIALMAEANDPQVFGAVMFVMSIGILGGFLVLLPFAKKMTTGLMEARERKDNTWGIVMTSCFMLTLIAVFFPLMIFDNPVSAATLFTSAFIAFSLGYIAKRFRLLWLNDFILALTLILAMVASVGWSNLLL
ncbi:DUF5058 family protein [Proteinivorax tanatarense]|uniref:DUF5058 family protein n=1 Tax=Proteinivorax tanatarense TaxID=1260629 RepID=A0AAU7VJS0_9FIRM